MLIHGDGNSNIVQDSCFNKLKWIKGCHIDTVLMNPPYNAQQKYCNKEYVANWSPKTKEDPSKGFHFVYEIAKQMTTGKLAVLLPPSCAIGSSRNKDIIDFKRKMLAHHHLDAVFSFPDDIFHPGSNSSACCMIFDIGVKHDKAPIKETFFGYFKDDGFKIKKNLGRIERKTDIWKKEIKPIWLKLYRKRISKAGISANRVIDENDEWLAEAYMETDYSLLTSELFENEIKSFYSYQIIKNLALSNKASTVKQTNFRKFYLKDIFTEIEYGKVSKANDQLEEGDDIWYLGAKKDNNGLMQKVKKETAFVSKGNCIVFICDGQGSVGYANYMDSDFVGTINLAMGYSERLNKYSGLYIATVVSLERPKFSYGRKWKPLLEFTEIKLPAILNPQTNKYEPDWQFMENYIKSLPYGDKI